MPEREENGGVRRCSDMNTMTGDGPHVAIQAVLGRLWSLRALVRSGMRSEALVRLRLHGHAPGCKFAQLLQEVGGRPLRTRHKRHILRCKLAYVELLRHGNILVRALMSLFKSSSLAIVDHRMTYH